MEDVEKSASFRDAKSSGMYVYTKYVGYDVWNAYIKKFYNAEVVKTLREARKFGR